MVLSTEAPKVLLPLSMNSCHWGFSRENHKLGDIEWRQALGMLSAPCQLPVGEQTFGGETASLGRKGGTHLGEACRHSTPLQGFPWVQGHCGPDLLLTGPCCRPRDRPLLTTLVQMPPVHFFDI